MERKDKMFTQPPFTYSDGINPPQPVPQKPGNPSQSGWSRFCPIASAQVFLALVQEMFDSSATLADETYSEQGYSQFGDNPDKVGVYVVYGTHDGAPIEEWAAQLIDRRVEPQAGIDKYPASPTPVLTARVTSGVAELSWQ